MQWTPRGAHLLLQARTQVLNDELDQTFWRWYPTFRKTDATLKKQRSSPGFLCSRTFQTAS